MHRLTGTCAMRPGIVPMAGILGKNDCGGYFLGKNKTMVVSMKPRSLAEKGLRCF